MDAIAASRKARISSTWGAKNTMVAVLASRASSYAIKASQRQ